MSHPAPFDMPNVVQLDISVTAWTGDGATKMLAQASDLVPGILKAHKSDGSRYHTGYRHRPHEGEFVIKVDEGEPFCAPPEPEPQDSGRPARYLEMRVTLSADSYEDLIGTMEHCLENLRDHATRDQEQLDADTAWLTAGYGSGHNANISVSPGVTHEIYFSAVTKWLADKKAAKAK